MSVVTFNYNSTLSNLIPLSGLAGSGISVLDANLITGFPPSTTKQVIVSLTRTSTTATLTSVAHGMVVGNVISIAGINNDLSWNGSWTVATTPTADTLTFTVSAQTTPATTLDTMTFTKVVSSLTRSSTTATLTCQGHGISSGATIFIAGVTNDLSWNGTWLVTGVTTDTLTFTVSSQTTPATSTATTGIIVKDMSVSSLTRSSTTCTLTTPYVHNFNIGDSIGIYGVSNDTSWNNSYIITTIPDSTHLTFETTGTPTSPATGTISVKYPPIGSYVSGGTLLPYWSKVFSATNQAIYRSLDPQSTQCFLRVDDSTVNYMTVSMLEGFSNFTAGLKNRLDVYWMKSDSSLNYHKPWMIVGDSKRFFLGTSWLNSSISWQGQTLYYNQNNVMDNYFFGDIFSVKAGDSYHCVIQGTTSTSLSSSYFCSPTYNSFYSVDKTTSNGNYILRSYVQLGSQQQCTKWSLSNTNRIGYDVAITFPNASDNGVYIDAVWVIQSGTTIRGKMPGFFAPITSTQWWFSSFDKSFIKDGRTYMYVRSFWSNYLSFMGFFLDVTPSGFIF